jgi:hypothetical protein
MERRPSRSAVHSRRDRLAPSSCDSLCQQDGKRYQYQEHQREMMRAQKLVSNLACRVAGKRVSSDETGGSRD